MGKANFVPINSQRRQSQRYSNKIPSTLKEDMDKANNQFSKKTDKTNAIPIKSSQLPRKIWTKPELF